MAKPKGPPVLRRSRRITLINKKTEEEIKKGQRSEDLVEEALQILFDQKKILWFLRSDWGDKYDDFGIDFLIWLETNVTVPLQVKSSRRGKEEFLAINDMVRCCVIVRPCDTSGVLAEKILEELGLSTKFLEDILGSKSRIGLKPAK